MRCGWERSPHECIIGEADRRTEEDSVMNNVIEATTDNSVFAAPGGVKWTLLLLLAAQDTRCIRARAQEDVAIDA